MSPHLSSWGLTSIINGEDTSDVRAISKRDNCPRLTQVHVSPQLLVADVFGDFDGSKRRFVALPSEPQGTKQKHSANPDSPRLQLGVVRHSLSGVIHGLRSRVHALLGDKVIYLALTGFGFAALAGIGLGLILDNFNRERKRIRLGWLLLLTYFHLFVVSFLLGLP
jgi:hypothetical protein